MVCKIITTNTLENFLSSVVIFSLQHQVFCMTSAAALRFLSIADDLQQSCCLMSLSFLLECWEKMVAIVKKRTVFFRSVRIVLE